MEPTKEQVEFIEIMRIWFKGEDSQNAITLNNIENAKKMIELFNVELDNQEERFAFDVDRYAKARIEFNNWCDENGLASYKK